MSRIVGLDKLFNKLDKVQSNAVITKAIDESAEKVFETARKECPVDDGALRASIYKRIEDAGLTAIIGTALSYAPFVEFGTGIHAAKGDGRKTPWTYQDEEGVWHTTAGQVPQPFLELALSKNKRKIRKLIVDLVKQEVKK